MEMLLVHACEVKCFRIFVSLSLKNLSFSLRNIFGRAEQLKVVSTTAFPQWGQTMQVEFTKPYYKDINKRLGEGVRGHVVSKLIRFSTGMGTTNFKQPASGYQEHIYEQKIQMQVRAREREQEKEGEWKDCISSSLQWFSRLGHHTLGWFCDWRELFGFDNGVPLSIRQDAGHSLKSSIKVSSITKWTGFVIISLSMY